MSGAGKQSHQKLNLTKKTKHHVFQVWRFFDLKTRFVSRKLGPSDAPSSRVVFQRSRWSAPRSQSLGCGSCCPASCSPSPCPESLASSRACATWPNAVSLCLVPACTCSFESPKQLHPHLNDHLKAASVGTSLPTHLRTLTSRMIWISNLTLRILVFVTFGDPRICGE